MDNTINFLNSEVLNAFSELLYAAKAINNKDYNDFQIHYDGLMKSCYLLQHVYKSIEYEKQIREN